MIVSIADSAGFFNSGLSIVDVRSISDLDLSRISFLGRLRTGLVINTLISDSSLVKYHGIIKFGVEQLRSVSPRETPPIW